MNKKLNRRIIVAGVIALLFIWVCLAFNNIDWAVLYAWILIGGGICVLVATNIKDIVSTGTSRARPVYSNEISKALEVLGYKVAEIDNNFVYFSDGNENYSLYSAWNQGGQLNIMCLYLTYSIKENQAAEFSRIASMMNREIVISRIRVTSNEDNTEYCLDFKADSLYSGDESLNATILSLVDYIHNARSRFDELRRASEADAKTVDYTEVVSNLINEKTKYIC